MKDKVIIITGASDGIGAAAARKLHEMGAEVVVVGRSPEKTKRIADELGVKYYVADFAKLDDVRQLAQKLKKAYPRIDVLINNAGGVFSERELTVDGYEKTMQVNHLAHFLLTNLLIDTLTTSKATVINTSSAANQLLAKFDIDDINMKHHHTQNSAYGNAKLENILFTKELDRRYHAKGISTAAVHPGVVATNFSNGSNTMMRFLYYPPLKYIFRMKTPDQGADTIVWIATSREGKDWKSGEYYSKRKIAKPNQIANDKAIATKLWELSEEYVQKKER